MWRSMLLVLGCVAWATLASQAEPGIEPSEPPRVTIEPEYPCEGRMVVSGSGFVGPQVHVGNQDVPVASDGTWRLEDNAKRWYVRPGGFNSIRIGDEGLRREIYVSIPFCLEALHQALEAPAVPVVQRLKGEIVLPRQKDHREQLFDTAVLHRSSDLAVVALSLGLPANTFAPLPAIDFDRDIGLLAVCAHMYDTESVSLMPFRPQPNRIVVQPIRWWERMGGEAWAFELVVIPRTIAPITFASPVAAAKVFQDRLKPKDRLEDVRNIHLRPLPFPRPSYR